MRALIALLFLSLAVSGCVSRSQDKADARAAYLAGQKDAFATIAATQRTSIKVIGPVQTPEVPWVEILTLRAGPMVGEYTPRLAIPGKSSWCAGAKAPRLIPRIC